MRLGLLALWLLTWAARAATGTDSLFTTRIAPLLTEHCLECHGGKSAKGGLELSTRELLLRGGDSGPAISQTNLGASLLLKLVRHEEKPFMPRKKDMLGTNDLGWLAAWVGQGAPYDFPLGTTNLLTAKPKSANPREFWSFRPLNPGPLPEAKDRGWIQTDVDRHILAKLEARGLKPRGPVSREKLLRRVCFDLIGLPPTPAQRDAFLGDTSPKAYEKLVGELLDSPAYGERWGRHWLDLARFAESNGYEKDIDRPHAYLYRDFVIKALNADMPYDQFVKWQLAGDEYDPEDGQAMAATGFCAGGPLESFQRNEKTRLVELDDILSTTGSAMLGLTIGCARCHDHKHDPVTQREYYRMLAAFATGAPATRVVAEKSDRKAYLAMEAEHRSVKAELGRWLLKLQSKYETTARAEVQGKITAAELKRWDYLAARNATLLASLAKISRQALVFTDGGPKPTNCFLLARGDPGQRLEQVDLGFPAVLQNPGAEPPRWRQPPPPGAKTTLQRRALAEWITDPEMGAGQLLARVIVNRLWQHHFGRGLVGTPNDFGSQGDRPTHPELLDWMASELIRGGWKLKSLQRQILLSAAYCQDTSFDQTSAEADPENRLLWRREPMRLESEIVRDTILAASGTLNPTLFGPSVFCSVQTEAILGGSTPKWPKDIVDGPETWRRSIYIFVKRSLPVPMLEVFDSPDTAESCGRRTRSTSPAQALELLHSGFMVEQARHLAARAYREAGPTDADRLRLVWILALSREPTPRELEVARDFCARQEPLCRNTPPAELASLAKSFPAAKDRPGPFLALADFCHALMNSNEFIYVD